MRSLVTKHYIDKICIDKLSDTSIMLEESEELNDRMMNKIAAL